MGGQIVDKGRYVGRMNGFLMRPEELFIVGIDIPPGAEKPHGPRDHAGWDPRVEYPLDIPLGVSLIQEGNISPIRVRKNGDLLEVVAGRQRTRSARWANEQIALHWREVDGEVPPGTCKLPPHVRESLERDSQVVLKTEITRGDDAAMLGITIAENIHRRGDTPMTVARKLGAYLDQGHSQARARATFNLNEREVTLHLRMLDLEASIQKLVDTRAVPMAAVSELADVSREQQVKIMALVEGQVTPAKIRKALDQHTGRTPKPRARPAPQPAPAPVEFTDAELRTRYGLLRRVAELLEADAGKDNPKHEAPSEDILLLRWVTGACTAEQVRRHIPWLAPVLQALQDQDEGL